MASTRFVDVALMLTPEQRDSLRAVAQENERPRSAEVRHLVGQHLRELEADQREPVETQP